MKTVNGTFHFIAIPSFRTIRFGGKGRLATSRRERTMEKIFFGAVKPEGALRASIERDMNGCIGHLEELAPTIVRDQKIYGADRLTRLSKQAELGRKKPLGAWFNVFTRYVFVGITALVIVLGIFYGGIG